MPSSLDNEQPFAKPGQISPDLVNLHGADLHSADLHSAVLHHTDLHSTDLHNIDLHSADLSETELVQALLDNQLLKQQLATQTQFMHLLTHQLATPLTSLSGFVDLLTEPSLKPDQQNEFLQVVQQQVQRLQSLLADLATIRNIETGSLETHPACFSLPVLVEEVVAAFNPYPVNSQFHADLPQVLSDRWQISQVLVNLISNAIKYTPDGSPVDVVATLLPSGWVEVGVCDHGLGIPAADQPHLFERFYRVKHSDRCHIQGTGLGLSLCKLLVENQGGQMGFESTHGQGSRFFFTLPCKGEAFGR